MTGIGIDFGTTNSVAAIYRPELKRVTALTNESTDLPHPSVVWYRPGGNVRVGAEAKDNLQGYSEVEGNRFVSSIKRRLGLGKTWRFLGKMCLFTELPPIFFVFFVTMLGCSQLNIK